MENTYADSGDSSPHSREIDSEHHSWEDQPPPNYRVKFMCSYNGKIQPRPHDSQLTYVGGDTKILAVDRSVRFADIMNKLSALSNSDVVFKYQLPGEDLDALISVTNDEDLEHMMVEYDRVYRLSPKPPRLRLFLFPNKNINNDNLFSPESDSKLPIQPNQQWLADSVNSVPVVVPTTQLTTDKPPQGGFVFPDKMINLAEAPNFSTADIISGAEESRGTEESVMSQVEIQRQIHQLQRMQIVNQEQAVFRKNSEESLARAFHGDYYQNVVQEKTIPGYWQDMNNSGYTTTGAAAVTGNGNYLIPPQPTTMYQTATPVTQGYYAAMPPRGQPEVYREQPVFSIGPPPTIIARPGGGEPGYTQVAYDSAGRQVFYAAAPGSLMPGAYQTVGGVDLRQVAPLNLTQEGKVATTAAV